jgi:hypothetical protein
VNWRAGVNVFFGLFVIVGVMGFTQLTLNPYLLSEAQGTLSYKAASLPTIYCAFSTLVGVLLGWWNTRK